MSEPPEETSWVLSNARRHAANPRMRSGAAIAAGNSEWPARHRAAVTRWESGAVAITHEVVRRYESLLGLPHGQLMCAVDFFSRSRASVRARATLSPAGEPDRGRTLELLDKATSTDRMSGAEWDELSDNVGRLPDALIRTRDWTEVIQRCLTEMGVSLSLEYNLRAEAVARLAGHPRSGPVVAELASSVLADPSAPLYNDTLSLLQYTLDAAVVDVLLRQLESPTNLYALRACLIALTSLVRNSRVTDATRMRASRSAVALIRDSHSTVPLQRGAANLLHALELSTRHRLAQGLSDSNRRLAASILLDGNALTAETTRAMHRNVRSTIEERLPHTDIHAPVLRSLLDNAVTANEEARGIALSILMMSPQGAAVGFAFGQELRRAVAYKDPISADECLTVLSFLAQPHDLSFLTAIVLDDSPHLSLVLPAAVAVGNCPDSSAEGDDERTRLVARRLAQLLAREGDVADSDVRGLTYILAMRGRFDLIDAAAQVVGTANDERRARTHPSLRAWLNVPEHIRPQPRN